MLHTLIYEVGDIVFMRTTGYCVIVKAVNDTHILVGYWDFGEGKPATLFVTPDEITVIPNAASSVF